MQIQITSSQKELKFHGEYNYPVYISCEILSRYESGSFCWHWHPEIELTLVLNGRIAYQINENLYELSPGEGLFSNTNTLHTGHMINQEDCTYISTTFHPRAIYGSENSLIRGKYVEPLLNNALLSSIHFTEETDWHHEVLKDLREIYLLSIEKPPIWELNIQMLLSHIWILICRNMESYFLSDGSREKNTDRVKTILSYIHGHYQEKLSLADIASAAGLCRSECCRFFKKYMNQPLFEYLLAYRIEQSLPYLLTEDHNVTEISGLVGFSNPSYYTRVFKKLNSLSPTEYRKIKQIDTSSPIPPQTAGSAPPSPAVQICRP